MTGQGYLPLAVLGLVLLEWSLGRWRGRAVHDLGETGATLVIALGQRLINAATAPLVLLPMMALYPYRLFDIQAAGAALPALFLGVELAYYWHHRAMHRFRLLWATHGVHHSTTRLNLLAAFRLGWGGAVTGGFVFYLPLVLVGFHPFAVLAMLALNLFYQLFLHVGWTPDLGPLEWVLNTPRHHHAHHAANDSCRDRNFGGVLIVFDRLFGTLARPAPNEVLRHGLAGSGRPERNPFRIALAGWADLWRRLCATRRPAQVWAALLGRP